ncbi:MAG: glycoside hydrolase family 31 protein [Clostridia bacterium]|nr:glycoside hydrolase family 31 protein [Clostridia bacterium]
MTEFRTEVFGRTLSISASARNTVRIRYGQKLSQSWFEKYSIFTPPNENAGEKLDSGVRAGDLAVSWDGTNVVFGTPRARRSIRLQSSDIQADTEYFIRELGSLRPEEKQIVGDETKTEAKRADFIKDPKCFTLFTSGERFYGLGESNVDRLILNGKAYLQRVIYTKSEVVIPYVMTKAGYAVSLNTTFWHGVDVAKKDPDEVSWFLPDGEIDFFIYAGDTLPELLERFTYVTGRCMVLPKWAYGLMFIDQYNADQFEVMRDASSFREKRIPCDSFSLEPGWMAKRYDFSTEKKWNTDRFYICDWMRRTEPEFEAHSPRDRLFTTALSRYGFKLLLWLCCRYDFTAHQENRAGNTTDFGFEPWFEHLKSFVCDGARGFKLDPCKVIDSADETRIYANGAGEAEMHSLQTTLYGKEMYEGYSEYTHLRPMHHLSGGYTSIQKYSACTTGDSGGRYKTLVWILNAGLSGVSNITCDMDIFAKHTIHYCFFTAWCELDSWSGYSHPWWAGDENEKLFTFYDRLRYHILPYIYSSALTAHLTGLPVARALPLVFEDEEAQDATTEYLFGDSYLVGCFSDTIYLPRGEKWIDAWTHKMYEGGQTLPVSVPEDRGGALFVRAGAIVPTQADKLYTDCLDDERLTLDAYPAADCDGTYTFYEDDGKTQKYLSGEIASTKMRLTRTGSKIILNVGPREGCFDGMRGTRMYTVKALTLAKPQKVTVDGTDTPFSFENDKVCFDMGAAREAVIEL